MPRAVVHAFVGSLDFGESRMRREDFGARAIEPLAKLALVMRVDCDIARVGSLRTDKRRAERFAPLLMPRVSLLKPT